MTAGNDAAISRGSCQDEQDGVHEDLDGHEALADDQRQGKREQLAAAAEASRARRPNCSDSLRINNGIGRSVPKARFDTFLLEHASTHHVFLVL